MKLSKIYILAAAFLFVGIIVFFIGFAMMGFNLSNFDTEPVYTPVKYTADGDLSGIVIKDRDADVRFELSDDKKVHIKYYENGIRTYEVTTLEGGILSVELKDNADWTQKLRLSRSTPVITVMLPAKFDGDIRVECENGDIDLEGITADGITTVSNGGSVKIIGCSIDGNLSSSSQNGNIELYNNTVEGAAQLSSYKGNILAQLITANEIYADTSDGYMTLADVTSLGNVFGECDGGDIRLSALDAEYGITLITENGDIRGSLKGVADDFSYNCNAQNGSCNLPQNQLGGSHNLNLRTQNGDIDVYIAAE